MSISASLLVYDIPTRLHYPNPSKILRRIAVRVNLSCWVVPNDFIPHHTLQRWDAHQIRWHLIPFAPNAGPQLVQLARDAILSEIDLLHRSMERRMREGVGVGNPEEQERYLNQLKVATSRAQKLLKDLEAASKCFGLPELHDPIQEAHVQVRQLTCAARANAAVYADAAYMATKNAEIAQQAEAAQVDQMAAYALADLLEDGGEDSRPLRQSIGQPV